MKLKPLHLFLILLAVLLLTCCLGNNSIFEGMSNNQRSATTYTGPQGNSATVVDSTDQAYNDEYNNNQYSSTTYTGSQGKSATVYTGPQGNSAVQPNNNVNYSSGSATTYSGSQGGSATVYTGSQGNQAVRATGPNGQTVVATPQNTVNGISRNQIPQGDEDLYILKSEVVPPVCPACPQSSACPREKPCPACPPCARCPEPAFECKKVPNYSSQDNRYLPKPLLNDFSAF